MYTYIGMYMKAAFDLLDLCQTMHCCLIRTFTIFSICATRVVRWFIFKPKIPIWANFWGPWMGKCSYIVWPFGILYGHLRYFMTIWNIFRTFGVFMTIWYILCSFGTFFPVLVSCTNKNLATLMRNIVQTFWKPTLEFASNAKQWWRSDRP
jgi:hypothetical protein